MHRVAAGLLLYRQVAGGGLEVLLVHPGGPFWARREAGAWTIPKGEPEPGEGDDAAALLAVARREVEEETGQRVHGPFRELPPVRQKGGKKVHAWAAEHDCDPAGIRSNAFEIEWPPRSGKRQSFPEIDRAAYFSLAAAREKINPAQVPWLDALARVG